MRGSFGGNGSKMSISKLLSFPLKFRSNIICFPCQHKVRLFILFVFEVFYGATKQRRTPPAMWAACWKWRSLEKRALILSSLFPCFSPLSSYPTPRYLWGVVATDGRAEDLMDQKRQGVTDPPGSPLVGEISDGPQDLF